MGIPALHKEGGKGLASNDERNIGHPYTSWDSHYDLIFIPYGDAASHDECLT